MSKLLKNTTGSAITISDTGVTIPASPGSYLIPATDYPLWTASDDVVEPIGSGDLLANDGNEDLSPSEGICLVQGNYVSHTGIRGRDGTLADVIDDDGVKRFAVDMKLSCGITDLAETIWAEDNGPLSNGLREWSFGNGSEGVNNVYAMYNGEITKAFIHAETPGTSVTIDVMINDLVAGTATFNSNGVYTFPTPIPVVEGDAIGFQTNTVTGTWSDVRTGVAVNRELTGLIGPERVATAVCAKLNEFTNYIPSGYSSPIPMDTTGFDTTQLNTMHDTTLADSGTATGTQTSTTLQDTTKSWTVNQFVGYVVRLTGGTGANRWAAVQSNTADTLTISPAWGVTPDGTTTYELSTSSRLIAPTSGIYSITGQVGFGNTPADHITYGIRFDINGTFEVLNFQESSSNTEHELGLTKVVQLNAGDYVEMQAYQGTGAESIFFAGSRTFLTLTKQ